MRPSCELTTLMYITGRASESCLRTSGGRTSSGSERFTRETRSRTSLAAESMSRSRSNSMLMNEPPSRLDERMDLMPSMPLI